MLLDFDRYIIAKIECTHIVKAVRNECFPFFEISRNQAKPRVEYQVPPLGIRCDGTSRWRRTNCFFLPAHPANAISQLARSELDTLA